MKNSEVFKAVKTILARRPNHPYGLCNIVMMDIPLNSDQRNFIIKWISSRLNKHGYYSDWLQANHPGFCKKMGLLNQGVFINQRLYHEGRLQWLDWIIDHWEKVEAQEAKTTKKK